ncbi:MAG: hypothetical protein K0S72_2185, partial [Arthrobacter sp.]|nr:hypothetical protein [Arthrobacter sp.]
LPVDTAEHVNSCLPGGCRGLSRCPRARFNGMSAKVFEERTGPAVAIEHMFELLLLQF